MSARELEWEVAAAVQTGCCAPPLPAKFLTGLGQLERAEQDQRFPDDGFPKDRSSGSTFQ